MELLRRLPGRIRTVRWRSRAAGKWPWIPLRRASTSVEEVVAVAFDQFLGPTARSRCPRRPT